MRFLDLDLDFFLNKNAYRCEHPLVRLSTDYQPWSAVKVRRFLEARCSLSRSIPLPGRVIESHDGVIEFWRSLIASGRLRAPFEVIHIDAHPDLSVKGGLCLAAGFLYLDAAGARAVLQEAEMHSGNYLTFALACGWLASLVWVFLGEANIHTPAYPRHSGYSPPLKAEAPAPGVPFNTVPWQKFKTGKLFDYMALSRSPEFTPPGSDALIPVVEEYIEKI